MMGTQFEVDENRFFDTCDEITSVSDSDSDCSDDLSNPGFVNYGSNGFGDEFWTKDLESVNERRERFLKWMDFSLDSFSSDMDEPVNMCSDETKTENRQVRDKRAPVQQISECRNRISSSQSSPCWQSVEDRELINDIDEEDSLIYRTEFVMDQTLSRLHHDIDSNEGQTSEEFENPLASSSFDRQLSKDEEAVTAFDKGKKAKKGWLQKLRIGHKHEGVKYSNVKKSKDGVDVHNVRVHTNKKRLKELSSVHLGQDFQAHKGSILAMKFSPNGQYLASGGEDSVVRVWKVIEDESESIFSVQNSDPSCLYFSLNHLSQLAPLNVDKVQIGKNGMLKKSPESACVIIPPNVFRLLERPVHEFCGHTDHILALSWSKNGHLITSSIDKTVRLWQVGNNDCLGVFSHNNYVTCVEFNPMDDNYFISGSIDGKVRIWEVKGCQVIDWIDVREIVSAVCYFPDGKGAIVGALDGSCRFYDIIDNRLEKGPQICLQGKKKLPGKRITGFQFSPSDPSKVMVTSADSQVRILLGVNVVCKFKGARSSGNQLSASFTSDGKHIVSASEDSNIYIWNNINQDHNHHRVRSKPKKVSSCESFSSHNASITLPWCGNSNISQTILPSPRISSTTTTTAENMRTFDDNFQFPKMPMSPSDCFSLGRGFFLEGLHRGTATWPEEKLPESPRTLARWEYKFLKNAYQNAFTSPHMWGQVIVTAGWDGRIRSFLSYGLPIRI